MSGKVIMKTPTPAIRLKISKDQKGKIVSQTLQQFFQCTVQVGPKSTVSDGRWYDIPTIIEEEPLDEKKTTKDNTDSKDTK